MIRNLGAVTEETRGQPTGISEDSATQKLVSR